MLVPDEEFHHNKQIYPLDTLGESFLKPTTKFDIIEYITNSVS